MERRHGIMMVLLGLAAGIAGAFIMMQLSQKAIKAEQFVLVDKKGQIHAILGLTNLGKPSLGLWDDEGKNRVILGFLSEDEPGLGLNDADGVRRVNLKLDERGDPVFVLYDQAGRPLLPSPPKEE